MEGDPQYMLLYYPLNMDQLSGQGAGRSALERQHRAARRGGFRPAGDREVPPAKGARVDAKTKLGWTPLMMAEGVFFANAKKEYPAAAAILRGASEGK